MQNSIIKSAFVVVSSLAVIHFIFSIPSLAQQIDLSLTPPNLELLTKPGTQISIPYSITNKADRIRLKPILRSFRISDQRDYVDIGNGENLPFEWSFVDQNLEIVDSFDLNNGEVKKILLLLDLPNTVSEGDYYISFIVESQPEYVDKLISARIKSQIASPLLITVTKTGRTEAKGEISVFNTSSKIFDSFDTVPITLNVKNLGKNFFNAGGKITVRGTFGETAKYTLLNENILTKSERLMTSNNAQDGSTLLLKGFLIGRYGVSASVVLADGTVQLNKSLSFIVFPFKLVIIAVLGSIVGIMLIRKQK